MLKYLGAGRAEERGREGRGEGTKDGGRQEHNVRGREDREKGKGGIQYVRVCEGLSPYIHVHVLPLAQYLHVYVHVA